MNIDDKEDTTVYKVVLNHEEQYSIWPVDREIPLGWREAGKSGLKPDCLELPRILSLTAIMDLSCQHH